MTRLSSYFVRDRQLIIVEAKIVGPANATKARLVLDTGAAATTLVPELIEDIGYTQRDSFKKAKVHTAVGEERGYWLRVAEFSVLGVTTPGFALTVFPLGHKDIDGLVGMDACYQQSADCRLARASWNIRVRALCRHPR